MAAKKTAEYVPSTEDLFAALASIPRSTWNGRPDHKSEKLIGLEDKAAESEAALAQFLATNPQYISLKAAEERDQKAVERQREKEADAYKNGLTKVQNAIRLRGNTPAVVKMVQELVEKFQ